MNKRLKQAREGLKLSQAFVARHLGIETSEMARIEDGTREVSAEELSVLSRLYGITTDILLCGRRPVEQELKALGRPFTELSGPDRSAVMDMLRFKQEFRKKRCAVG